MVQMAWSSAADAALKAPKRMVWHWLTVLWVACTLFGSLEAISLDVNDPRSIKTAATQIAADLMTFYKGNQTGQTPGLLPQPIYWWEAGAMFNTLINYWHLTNDSSYNDVTSQAMLHQVGQDKNYMPSNQTSTLGNDDQAMWAFTALSAAEFGFPNPPSDQPQWLALAQAVFNSQVPRWDNTTCGGGLHWQIFQFNAGYNYKNAVSNGAFFTLAARLARYTSNQTYVQWAETAWNWMESAHLLDPATYAVYDGSFDLQHNCAQTNKVQWTYNVGLLLLGAANMYNFTNGSTTWHDRTQKLLSATAPFFDAKRGNVLVEMACENGNTCNNDQLSFKAYLTRWMAASTQLAPFTRDTVMARLQTNAKAAAQQCSGGSNGRFCGFKWTQGATWDGTTGPGQQMNALEVIQSLLVQPATSGSNAGGNGASGAPFTQSNGGTSKGNPSAGTTPSSWNGIHSRPITTADRAGAGILTVGAVGLGVAMAVWLITGS